MELRLYAFGRMMKWIACLLLDILSGRSEYQISIDRLAIEYNWKVILGGEL